MKEVKSISYSPETICAFDCYHFHDGFCTINNNKLFYNGEVYYRSINCFLHCLLMEAPAKNEVYTCFGQAHYNIVDGEDPLPLTLMTINQNDEEEEEINDEVNFFTI